MDNVGRSWGILQTSQYTWHWHLNRRSITWCLIMSSAYEHNEVGNGTMHHAQEHTHLGIDYSIQRPIKYIYEHERNSFLTQSVTIKLNFDQILKIVTKRCQKSDFWVTNHGFLLFWSQFSKILPNSKNWKKKAVPRLCFNMSFKQS